MAKVIIPPKYLNELAQLDEVVRDANERKRKVLFKALGIKPTPKEIEGMQEWKLIPITVADNQMAVQLNKIVAYMPNIMFVVDVAAPVFSLREGERKRRIRKDR